MRPVGQGQSQLGEVFERAMGDPGETGSVARQSFLSDRGVIYFYNLLLLLAIIAGLPLVLASLLGSKKRRTNVLGRLGIQPYPKSVGRKPIWIHALSVGEVMACLPLLRRIQSFFPTHPVHLSVSTVTGHDTATRLALPHVQGLFYFPLDLLWSVRRAISSVDPCLFVLVESDIWPNFLYEMKRRDIPAVLVNGRVSPRSFSGYWRLRFFMGPVLSWFSAICAQSRHDWQCFHALGIPAERVTMTGSLKFDREQRALTAQEIEELRRTMKIDRDAEVIVAGSTHQGEEAVLEQVFSKLKTRRKQSVLVVVPRDPNRAVHIRRFFSEKGWCAASWSQLDQYGFQGRAEVIVADVLGILGRLYAVADVAFVGGSLVPCGGHNPLEPAALERPVLFGPHMSDFSAIAKSLVASGGAVQVRDGDDLYEHIVELFQDERRLKDIGKRAVGVFEKNKGATDETLAILRGVLNH